MIVTQEQAQGLRHVLQTEVGRLILAMLDDEAKEPESELFHIMTSKPETLTGRTAIAKANQIKALRNFKELLLDTANQAQPEGAAKK